MIPLLFVLFGMKSNVLHDSLQCDPLTMSTFNNNQHLVVLSHGILGTSRDLEYLSLKLESRGCTVLKSSVNENLRSLYGIRTGGKNLAEEILEICRQNRNLQYISFVGNSLGGLYAR
eukprot:gene12547-26425_t